MPASTLHVPTPASSKLPNQVIALDRWLPLSAGGVLLLLVVRSAWVSEDAYITLRTVDNWLNGYGMRWNVDERVQGFTHPLWMLLLTLVQSVARQEFISAIVLGVLATVAMAIVLVRNARSPGHAVVGLVLLTLSRSFVEFSTSGLENSLAHALGAAFLLTYLINPTRLLLLSLLASLLLLTRHDAGVLLAPALAHATWISVRDRGVWRTVRDGTLGLTPFLAWELFSLFYFGLLLPNTAYAKLNTGIPTTELAWQGAAYLLYAVAWDPALLLGIGVGCAVGLAVKRWREAMVALGILLYLAYVVRIGGDFMLGRFLTLPLLAAICLIVRCDLPLDQPSRALFLLVPVALLSVHPLATELYPVSDFEATGVAHERGVFRNNLSVMMVTRRRTLPDHEWVQQGRDLRKAKGRVHHAFNIGLKGYFAGPSVHLVDALALTEPLLARLPARYNPKWRVGHYGRFIPDGYLETLESGKCAMKDKNLCEYNDKVREIVAGDLWSVHRLGVIAAMARGSYDHLIDQALYRHPEVAHVDLAKVATAVAEGAIWDAPGAMVIGSDGAIVALPSLSHAGSLAVVVDGNDWYQLEFRAHGQVLGSVQIDSSHRGGLVGHTQTVPAAAKAGGFDSVYIVPVGGDGMYSFGFMRLRP